MVFGLFGTKKKDETATEQAKQQNVEPPLYDATATSEAAAEVDQHNRGQPVKANLDSAGKQRSKFLTDCSEQHAASLKCIEENYTNRAACQSFFEAYKTCRREEKHRRQVEEKEKKWQRTHHY